MFAGAASPELAYAQGHSVPPLMLPEPFRYLGFQALNHWWQRRQH